eukprot:7481198-Pyramimonas_sp.AAC.1
MAELVASAVLQRVRRSRRAGDEEHGGGGGGDDQHGDGRALRGEVGAEESTRAGEILMEGVSKWAEDVAARGYYDFLHDHPEYEADQ